MKGFQGRKVRFLLCMAAISSDVRPRDHEGGVGETEERLLFDEIKSVTPGTSQKLAKLLRKAFPRAKLTLFRPQFR